MLMYPQYPQIVENNIQASREQRHEYKAASFRAQRPHRRKKAAAFWICVQQQREARNNSGQMFAELWQ